MYNSKTHNLRKFQIFLNYKERTCFLVVFPCMFIDKSKISSLKNQLNKMLYQKMGIHIIIELKSSGRKVVHKILMNIIVKLLAHSLHSESKITFLYM